MLDGLGAWKAPPRGGMDFDGLGGGTPPPRASLAWRLESAATGGLGFLLVGIGCFA
jgi:hypothetical protein